MDFTIGELADRQHGVVARWQLLALGIGSRALEVRISRGRLYPLHRGVYAVGCRSTSVRGRWMAAVLAVGSDAVLSHGSAGRLWGILRGAPGIPEVTSPGGWRPRTGIEPHRACLPWDETGEIDEIPVTSVPRTLFDLAGVLTRRQLERAMNEAEVRQLTDRLSLRDLMDRYPRRRGSANLRALLAAKAPGGITRNEFEERFVGLLDSEGLPRPRLNATLAMRGRFFEVDCLWREQRLIAELDGHAVHGTDQAFEDDRQRDRILLAEGWRFGRVTWRQLRDEPAAVAADLRSALQR